MGSAGHASLGKQTLCQLSYSRSGAPGAQADRHSSEGPSKDQRRRGLSVGDGLGLRLAGPTITDSTLARRRAATGSTGSIGERDPCARATRLGRLLDLEPRHVHMGSSRVDR